MHGNILKRDQISDDLMGAQIHCQIHWKFNFPNPNFYTSVFIKFQVIDKLEYFADWICLPFFKLELGSAFNLWLIMKFSRSVGIDYMLPGQILTPWWIQHKQILERTLPDALKLSIAKKIENNLFSKVLIRNISCIELPLSWLLFKCRFPFLLDSKPWEKPGHCLQLRFPSPA